MDDKGGKPWRKRTGGGGRASGKQALRLGSIMDAALPGISVAAKLTEYRLIKLWPEIAGPTLSKRVQPLKLVGTVLYCTVSTSSWMTELTYQKDLLISRINDATGSPTVTELILRLGKVAPSPAVARKPPEEPLVLTAESKRFINETTRGIKDAKLRAAVKRAMEKYKT